MFYEPNRKANSDNIEKKNKIKSNNRLEAVESCVNR